MHVSGILNLNFVAIILDHTVVMVQKTVNLKLEMIVSFNLMFNLQIEVCMLTSDVQCFLFQFYLKC